MKLSTEKWATDGHWEEENERERENLKRVNRERVRGWSESFKVPLAMLD